MQRFTSSWRFLLAASKMENIFCGSRFMRHVYGMVLTVILVLAYIWLYAGYQIGSDYDRDIRAIQLSHTVAVRDFAQHLVRSVDERDRLLKLMRDDYQENGSKIDLQRYTRIFGGLYSRLNVFDRDGRVVASLSQAEAAGSHAHMTDLYVSHRDHPDDSLRIAVPRRLPGSEQWVIRMARRIFSASGEFDGIVELIFSVDKMPAMQASVALIRADERFSADSDAVTSGLLSVNTSMMLRRIDDTIIDFDDKQPGTSHQLADGQVNRSQPLWLSRKLDPYPLVLSVKLPDPDPLAVHARHSLIGYIMYAGVPSLLILLFIALTYRTISRQYEVVRAYDSLRRRASDSNKRKSRFLATVVHELRTPLSGIHGYSELVRDTSNDPQSREFGDLIHQSAIYLHGLLNTLFDLARIEAGRVVIFHENIVTLNYFEYIGSMHKINADKKGLTFQMRLAPDLPSNFLCDRVRLSQILHNMLDNAIKFTLKGGVTMEVSVVREKLKIRVMDTGPGIPRNELKHLFEYFYQSESVRAGRGRGLGLGLSLAKEFTDLIRGSIRIDSELGVGTVVNLSIPLNAR